MKAPRILAFMGSGETAPTMVTPHRDIVARLGDVPPRAVLLDTPYGFQENGPEITQKAVEYFAKRRAAHHRRRRLSGPLAADPAQRTAPGPRRAPCRACAPPTSSSRGPGQSVVRALRLAGLAELPEALATRLTDGAALVFASAAA